MRAVDEVLNEIGAGERPRILVLNKIDALDEDARGELFLRHPDAVEISAATGEGLDDLVERIDAALAESLREVRLLMPYDEGGRLAELHDIDAELEREDTPEGVRVTARVPAPVAARFAAFSVNGANGGSPAAS